MPITTETLNGQLVAREVHTGVYQSHQRRIAIVVQVKAEKVAYLTLTENCRIELVVTLASQFLRDHPIELYHYPVLRAVRHFIDDVRKDKFAISDEARKVINAIMVRK